MKKVIFTTFIVTLGALRIAHADSTHISNQVTNSVSTGGNSASGGTVVNGEAHSSVSVHTEVNGQVVEDIHKDETSADGNVSSQVYDYATSSGDTHVETHIEVNGNANASTSGSSLIQKIKDKIFGPSSPLINLKEKEEATSSSALTETEEKMAAEASSTSDVNTHFNIVVAISNIFNYVFSLFKF